MKMRKLIIGVALMSLMLLAGLAGTSTRALAADYPSKPIKLICPFGAGSGSDRILRIAQPYMKKALGQEIVMDYKSGGGGVVGANYYMTTKADGYSLLTYNQPHIMIQEKFMKTAYSTDNLIPLLGFTWRPEIITVKEDSPFKTFQDLVDYAKANPGKLTIGNTGTFSSNHLTYAMMVKATGIDVVRVPFKSGGQMNAALLGDQIDACVSNKQWLTIHAGKIRALVSASSESFIEGVPTFKELGYGDLENAASNFVFVKAGTPDDIVKYLQEKLAPLSKDEQLKKEFLDAGVDYAVFTADQCVKLVERIKSQIAESSEMISKDNAK